MRLLSDELLVDSYYRAMELKLDQEFIRLLLSEIRRRNIPSWHYDNKVSVAGN